LRPRKRQIERREVGDPRVVHPACLLKATNLARARDDDHAIAPAFRAIVNAGSKEFHMKCGNVPCVLGIVAFAALAGCAATAPAVVPAGDDAYSVRVPGARYETQADTNLRALSLAETYCDKLAKHVMFRESTESSQHSWSPKQEELTFVCMDAKDPAYMRASLEHDPSVVAQQ
jgi:hypothetical protein